MSTQKEIKILIEENEKKILSLNSDFSENQDWVSLKEEQKKVEDRLAEIKKEKFAIESKIRTERQSEIILAYSDRNYLHDLLTSKENGLNPTDFNEDLQIMFKSFYAGSDWGDKKVLQWVSDDGKFAIFKKKAFRAYINRGQSTNSEAFWCLFTITNEFKGYDGSVNSRLDNKSKYCISVIEGGRWNKDKEETFMNAIKRYILNLK